jgi:asparagine synthase (glutamine-hydrolysing)
MAADLSAYLPEDIMHITDRMSMSVSLEAREPFLDTGLVDFMLRVPSGFKLDARTRQRKILLQRLARPRLPAEIFAQPKQGFGGPIGAWMRGGLIDTLKTLMRDSAAVRAGLLDAAGVREYLARPPQSVGRQRDVQLWTLLILEIWTRVMLEGQGASPGVSLDEMAANS